VNKPNSLEGLIQNWSARLRKAFLDCIYATRDSAQIALIVRMLEKHDVDGALRAVNLDPTQFRGLDKTISDGFEAAGNFTADALPPLRQPSGHRLEIGFDVRNPRAEAWLRDHSATMVTQIVDDQHSAIRQHLEAGMVAGDNPKTVALDLVGRVNAATGKREGGVIGLTASQEAWTRKYAAELAAGDPNALTRALRDKRFDKTVQAAIRDGKPIPAELQAKMTAAYKARALRFRAETIGRTEALTSLHQGQHEAMRQGVDAGQVQVQNVTKVWKSAADNRVRETHRALNGAKAGFSAAFVSPSGARLMFPGDPSAPPAETIQCRCWLMYRVNHFAGVV
jgi:hypothetical protein